MATADTLNPLMSINSAFLYFRPSLFYLMTTEDTMNTVNQCGIILLYLNLTFLCVIMVTKIKRKLYKIFKDLPITFEKYIKIVKHVF